MTITSLGFAHLAGIVAILRGLRADGGMKRRHRLGRVRKAMRCLQTFAAGCPENHQSRLYTAEGFWYFFHGEIGKALVKLDRAEAWAFRERSIADQAIAREQIAHVHFESGNVEKGKAWLRKSSELYDAWGASSKGGQIRSALNRETIG